MSSSIRVGLPSKRTSSRNFTHNNRMGSLIVSSKKEIERTKPSNNINLTERRSVRLRTHALLDPQENIKSNHNKPETFVQIEQINCLGSQEKQFKTPTKVKRKTPSIIESNRESFNKKPKILSDSQVSISVDETKEKSNFEEQKAKRNKKKNHTIFWESKLTGARRVSKRLSKLEMKNKQIHQQKVVPVYHNRKTGSIRHIATKKNETTYEKSTSKRLYSASKLAHKRVKSNTFIVNTKVVRDEDITEDEDIVVSLKPEQPQTEQPENKCTSCLEELDISVHEVSEGVKECQELDNKTEQTAVETVSVTNNEEGGDIILVENVQLLENPIEKIETPIITEVVDLEISTSENSCKTNGNELELSDETLCSASSVENIIVFNIETECSEVDTNQKHIKKSPNDTEEKDDIDLQCTEERVEPLDVEVTVEEKFIVKEGEPQEPSQTS